MKHALALMFRNDWRIREEMKTLLQRMSMKTLRAKNAIDGLGRSADLDHSYRGLGLCFQHPHQVTHDLVTVTLIPLLDSEGTCTSNSSSRVYSTILPPWVPPFRTIHTHTKLRIKQVPLKKKMMPLDTQKIIWILLQLWVYRYTILHNDIGMYSYR